jgi:mono/diheme cytochrome c family protein
MSEHFLSLLSYKLLNDQSLAKSEFSLQRTVFLSLLVLLAIVLMALGVYHVRKSDPYTRDVLYRMGDAIQGNAIFQMNCAGCHGFLGDGRVGPSLKGVAARKSRVALIKQVTSGKTPPMPQFQPSPQEMADLLSYLESL